MAEPSTGAGRALLGAIRSGAASLFALKMNDGNDDAIPLAIIAVEAQAVEAWLQSPEAEDRLAVALLTYRPRPPHERALSRDEVAEREAEAILAALRDSTPTP